MIALRSWPTLGAGTGQKKAQGLRLRLNPPMEAVEETTCVVSELRHRCQG